MRLIRFAVVLVISLIVAPLSGAAQQAERAARIGFLGAGSPSDPLVAAFNQGLRELGYVEGRNISIEYRWVVTSEQLPSRPRGQASYKHNPYRHADHHRPCRARSRREPRSTGRERHGVRHSE